MKFLLILLFSVNLIADDSAITHGPIGVMGDHTHDKGELMLSFRVMSMSMRGMRQGTGKVEDNEYTHMIKPQDMHMKMYMFGGMYGLTDKITLMPMINYVTNDMELKNSMSNVSFDTKTGSFGDTKIVFLHSLIESDSDHGGLVLKYGLSLPTGKIDEKDNIPGMGEVQLPYPMQIGSGTYDLIVGANYQGYYGTDEDINLGANLTYVLRTGENDQDYTLGDEATLDLWGAYGLTQSLSVSARINWKWRGEIDGTAKDLTIMPSMNPLADTNNSSGNWTHLFVGKNYLFDTGDRLALEIGFPINQNVNGLQMDREYQWVLGWQKVY